MLLHYKGDQEKEELLLRQDAECTHQPICYKICRVEEAEMYDNSVVSRKLIRLCEEAAVQQYFTAQLKI
jgi:hypothetical protein